MQIFFIVCTFHSKGHCQDPAQSEAYKKLSLDQDQIQWLKTNNEINIYTNQDLFPYSFKKESAAPGGLVVDVAERVASLLGIKINLIPVRYRKLIELMREGSVSGVSFVDSGDYPYNAPYLTSKMFVVAPYALFTRSDRGYKPKSLKTFTNKTIALYQGSTPDSPIYQAIEGNRIVFVESVLDGTKMVLEGKVDGYVDVYAPVINAVNTHFFTGIESVLVSDIDYYGSFIIRNDLKHLYRAMEKALEVVIEEDLPSIMSKWNTHLDKEPLRHKLRLTVQEQAWLNEHRGISVAMDQNWAPIEYVEHNGIIKGLSTEYLNQIEDILKIKFRRITSDKWSELVEKGQEREVDMYSCVVKTPQRETYLDFTQPYLSLPTVIFAHRQVPYIGGLDQLAGKKVAAVEGYAIHDYLKKNHPQIKIMAAKDTASALESLANEEVYAFIGCILTGSHYIAQKGLFNLKVAGETPYRYDLAMATRSDWPMFSRIIQKAIDTISEQERTAFYNKWITVKYEQKFDYSIIWKAGSGVLLILLVIGLWNRRMASEISQRKKTEAELSESRHKYKNLFENLMDVYYRTDAKGNFIMVSPSVKKLHGYEPEELLGTNVADLYYDRADAELSNKYLKERGRLEGFETRYITKGGRTIWGSTNAKILEDENGEILGVEGLTRDISEQKKIEKSLKESELQYKVIFDNSPLGIYRINSKGTLTYCNDKAIELFGSSREALVGFNFPTQLVNEKLKRVAFRAQSGRTSIFEGTYTSVTGNKTTVLRMVFNPVAPDNIPSPCIVTMEDISERRKAEENLKAALDEKEVLLREIHHRVKNSMQVMSGLLQLQADRTDDTETVQAFEDSQNRIQAMALVHQILYQSENMAKINLRDYLFRLSQALQSALDGDSSRINLNVEAEDILLGLEKAVPCGLAINEILSNAYKHAFPNGSEGQIDLLASTKGTDEVEIQVIDNGIGLPEGMDMNGGSSLGVFLISGLIQTQLGGTLEIENNNGASIKFRFNITGRTNG